MNPYKSARRLSPADREARALIASTDRIEVLRELVAITLQHVAGLLPGTANNTMDAAGAAAGHRER